MKITPYVASPVMKFYIEIPENNDSYIQSMIGKKIRDTAGNPIGEITYAFAIGNGRIVQATATITSELIIENLDNKVSGFIFSK